jgi:hypothetical protein
MIQMYGQAEGGQRRFMVDSRANGKGKWGEEGTYFHTHDVRSYNTAIFGPPHERVRDLWSAQTRRVKIRPSVLPLRLVLMI